MSIPESLLIAAFNMIVVFAVLVLLFLIIRLFSFAIYALSNKKQEESVQQSETDLDFKEDEIFSSGKLILKNVDEPTSAMIMAIVSHESNIPLSELCFKSIKLIERQS